MATITIGPTNGATQKYDVVYIGATQALNATNFPWYTAANVVAVYTKSANRQGYVSSKPGSVLTSIPQLTLAATNALPNVYELNIKARITLDTTQFYVLGAAAIPRLDAPVNLQSTSTSTSSLTLAASTVANATGYLFQLSTDSGFIGGLLNSPAQANPTYVFTGLVANTTYYTRVLATGNGTTYADSPYSSAFQAKTQPAASGSSGIATDDGANAATFALPSGDMATAYTYEILP